jgi:transposase InsO family protein
MQHPNARLTVRGRLELVLFVDAEGHSFRQAAQAFRCSVSTAFEWVARWRAASVHERRGLACLCDRSSRPHRSPRLMPALAQARIVRCRPGDLLHMDTKRYARFARPGHALTGVRDRTEADRRARVGYQFAHAIVDDHSRLAYVELHDDERAGTVTAFTARALAWFARRGIRARRLMTDGAWAYTRNRSLADLLAERRVRHLVTRPYRPQTNGKVERFHQTMAREWGYGMLYLSHRHRQRALRYWLGHYG